MSTKASQKGTKGQTPGMTTIRERLQKAISRLVVFSIIPLVILTVILNLSSTMRTLEGDMLVVAEISADRINEELRVTTRMQLPAVFSGIYPGAEATVYQPACGSLWNGQRQADRLQRYLCL